MPHHPLGRSAKIDRAVCRSTFLTSLATLPRFFFVSTRKRLDHPQTGVSAWESEAGFQLTVLNFFGTSQLPIFRGVVHTNVDSENLAGAKCCSLTLGKCPRWPRLALPRPDHGQDCSITAGSRVEIMQCLMVKLPEETWHLLVTNNWCPTSWTGVVIVFGGCRGFRPTL